MKTTKIDKCFCKGDTINFEACIHSDITGWKIRAELYDDSNNSIRLANDLSGGDVTQIEVIFTSADKSRFLIKVEKGLTTTFDDSAFLEIEVETDDMELFTVMKAELCLTKQRIEWETP